MFKHQRGRLKSRQAYCGFECSLELKAMKNKLYFQQKTQVYTNESLHFTPPLLCQKSHFQIIFVTSTEVKQSTQPLQFGIISSLNRRLTKFSISCDRGLLNSNLKLSSTGRADLVTKTALLKFLRCILSKKPRPCFYLCRSCEANWFFLFLLFSFHCFFSFHFLLSHTKPIIKVKLIGLFNQRRKASAKHNISPLLFLTSAVARVKVYPRK